MEEPAFGTEEERGEKPGRVQAESRCEMTVNVRSKGPVNIYNCPPETVTQPEPEPEECPECPEPPRATGACIPVALGAKPKRAMADKLNTLARNSPAPSVLAATILQQAGRYLAGRQPGNELERSVFAVLDGLPPELRDILSCTLKTFEALPRSQRDDLFAPEVSGTGDQALSAAFIAGLFVEELEARAADALFDDAGCTEERPGLARPVFSVINGGAFLGFIPSICRVNGLRTIYFTPPLGVGDYEPQEFERKCTSRVVDGQVEVDCEVQTDDCPGHRIAGDDGACLRVPDVATGESVLLEGVNFFDVDARVTLRALAPGTASAEVDAFVCGDQETAASEEVNGVQTPINDCRVHDRLTFQIPDELPVGVYEVRVVVPNNTGVEDTDPEYTSEEVFIRVVPPATAEFQIASEEIHAKKETAIARFGSDEVGLRILSVPILADNTLGSMQTPVDVRFGDVDSGDTRDLSRVLIRESGLSGVSIAIIGFEIDSERAFENQIDSFTEAFVDILKRVWDQIKEEASGAAAGIVKKYGVKGIIAVAIAAAAALVIIAIAALWAPADLIIEDHIGYATVDLAELTNANFPAPPEFEYTSTGGIDVKIVTISKGVQYRERREYRSDEENSEYHLKLRYNRLS